MTSYKPIPTLSAQQECSFWERVAIDMYDTDACFPWKGERTWRGYGTVRFDRENYAAHRVAYTLTRGPIPDGLTLDHLCRNKACCNPAHLDPCTAVENRQRFSAQTTHCKRGHLLPAYTAGIPRECVTCSSLSKSTRRAKLRASGLCITCEEPSKTTRCTSCAQRHNAASKGRKRSGKHKGKSW